MNKHTHTISHAYPYTHKQRRRLTLIPNACERARERQHGERLQGGEGGRMGKEGRGRGDSRGQEGAGFYLISAEVSIEQKVQQAGSVVKPRVLL